jgi:hypothetical protein
MSNDPMRMRNQPALRTSSGLRWLVVGAALTAIALVILVPMTEMPPTGVAGAAIIADLALLAGMVVARLVVPHGAVRLRVMAVALGCIAIVSLGAVLMVATAAVPVS